MKTILHITLAGLIGAGMASAKNEIYGATFSEGVGSLWVLDLELDRAAKLADLPGIKPNALATNQGRPLLYFAQEEQWDALSGDWVSSLKIHYHDRSSGTTGLLVDLVSHPLFAGGEDPDTVDNGSNFLDQGAAWFQGAYYFFVARVDRRLCSRQPIGAGRTLYKLELQPNGKAPVLDQAGHAKLTELTVGPLPAATPHSLGDFGDFVILQDGTVFGSTWSRVLSGEEPCQVSGYWTCHLSDPEHSFKLLKDTNLDENNPSYDPRDAPTYQLAIGSDGRTVYGQNWLSIGSDGEGNRIRPIDIVSTLGPGGLSTQTSFPLAVGPAVPGVTNLVFRDLSSARGPSRVSLTGFELLEETENSRSFEVSWDASSETDHEIQTSQDAAYWASLESPVLFHSVGQEEGGPVSREIEIPADWKRGFVRVLAVAHHGDRP